MDNPAIEVLQWTGVALGAGGIGYFGRYLAMILIERARRKRTDTTAAVEPSGETPASPEERLAQTQLKTEKKRAKAEAKKAKKERR